MFSCGVPTNTKYVCVNLCIREGMCGFFTIVCVFSPACVCKIMNVCACVCVCEKGNFSTLGFPEATSSTQPFSRASSMVGEGARSLGTLTALGLERRSLGFFRSGKSNKEGEPRPIRSKACGRTSCHATHKARNTHKRNYYKKKR